MTESALTPISTRFATRFAPLSSDWDCGEPLVPLSGIGTGSAELVNREDNLDRIEKVTRNTLVTLSRSRSAGPEPCRPHNFEYQHVTLQNVVPRRFQWYIAEGMLSLPTAKWSMVISFFSGVMASGFAFGCAKDTVEFFNAGIGEVRFPVGEGFLLVIFDYVGPWV